MNKREEVVQKLMQTEFRIDSLSSCLNNMEPNSVLDTSDKGNVMRKYLFHLAFENQNTNDYITEKLWGTLSSGTLPVYLGAPNIKDHVPFKGVIFVEDFPSVEALAKYLVKVSNDRKLYESYHSWREEPLPQSFLIKYNISHTHSKCRTCRWAHARKYGLGWNHTKQSLEPVFLPRETCVKGNHLASPAVESWWVADADNHENNKLELKIIGDSESLCPFLPDDVSRAKLGNSDLIRSVWSHDGTTDILIEGETFYSYTLQLAFPLKHHEAPQYIGDHTLWIQDDRSRVSLAFSSYSRFQGHKEIVTALSGVFHVHVTPELLPLRIRIIVENVDTFHEGATEQPSYYGHLMANDIANPPHLFSVDRLNELEQFSLKEDSSDRALSSFQSLHFKSSNNGRRHKKRPDT
ncbi:hypothetical protein HJC23_008885 [Cyclotella cryptica]|uniref:Fucosyltransferase n=1 Tax=Cyclotella cryptica TaxID=29204 RepID=A0ABD3PC18_9STRA